MTIPLYDGVNRVTKKYIRFNESSVEVVSDSQEVLEKLEAPEKIVQETGIYPVFCQGNTYILLNQCVYRLVSMVLNKLAAFRIWKRPPKQPEDSSASTIVCMHPAELE